MLNITHSALWLCCLNGLACVDAIYSVGVIHIVQISFQIKMWQEARNVSSFFRGVANLGKHQTHYLDTVSLQVPATPRPTYKLVAIQKKTWYTLFAPVHLPFS